MIGTPFHSENERIQRKVDKMNAKPWEQEVRDEKGRRRFHGAFTGGFSAGYFNTCGSEEGWTPSAFVSSRKDKNEIKRASVLDFMDKDDITDQVGQTSTGVVESSAEVRAEGSHHILGELSKEILTDLNNETGEKLMQTEGFKRVESFSRNQFYCGELKFKVGYSGVGYRNVLPTRKEQTKREIVRMNAVDDEIYDNNDNYDDKYFETLEMKRQEDKIDLVRGESLQMAKPTVVEPVVPEGFEPTRIEFEENEVRERPSVDKRRAQLSLGSVYSRFAQANEADKPKVEEKKEIALKRERGFFYPSTLLLKRFKISETPSHCTKKRESGLSELQAKILREEKNQRPKELSVNDKNMEDLSKKAQKSLFDEIFN